VATGQRVKGCAIAGISRRELQAALEAQPEFREAVETAEGEYADGLAVGLVETGRKRENPVGHIVALKALRPLEYIERSASLSVSADLNHRSPITEAGARELLRQMFASTTETTRKMLAGAPPATARRPEAP
jgi:plasmid stability protein